MTSCKGYKVTMVCKELGPRLLCEMYARFKLFI